MNIPIGSTLTFSKDQNITSTVVKARKVLFRGEEVSPSAAALAVVHEMGYDWAAVSGMDYWEFQGIKLSQIGGGDSAEEEPEL
jgi:hypothetical protein